MANPVGLWYETRATGWTKLMGVFLILNNLWCLLLFCNSPLERVHRKELMIYSVSVFYDPQLQIICCYIACKKLAN